MSQSSSHLPAPTGGDFILYTAPGGAVKVDVFFKGETVWLTQKALAELFGVKVPAINKHLKNIFDSGELVDLQLFPFWKQLPPTAKPVHQNPYRLLEGIDREFSVFHFGTYCRRRKVLDLEIKRLEGKKL
jgi:hypothetical protein